MADERLISYIKQQIARGYSTTAIRSYLLRYYPPAIIEEAFQQIDHKKFSTKLKIFSSILALLIIMGFIFFIFREEELKLKTTAISKAVYAGEKFSFKVEIDGIDEDQTVSLRHEILDNANKPISFKEENAVGPEKQSSIDIPSDADGFYRLRTRIANEDAPPSTISFQVQKRVELPRCPDECDDDNLCTRDICSEETGFRCGHEPIAPCCGDAQCDQEENYETCSADCEKTEQFSPPQEPKKSLRQILAEIKEVASRDISQAGKLCGQLEKDSAKDQCYNEIAQYSNEKSFCSAILDNDKRDSCYMNYAIDNNDYSICDLLEDDHLRGSCNSLAKLGA